MRCKACAITLDQKSVLGTQIYSLPSRRRPNILQHSNLNYNL